LHQRGTVGLRCRLGCLTASFISLCVLFVNRVATRVYKSPRRTSNPKVAGSNPAGRVSEAVVNTPLTASLGSESMPSDRQLVSGSEIDPDLRLITASYRPSPCNRAKQVSLSMSNQRTKQKGPDSEVQAFQLFTILLHYTCFILPTDDASVGHASQPPHGTCTCEN